MYRHLIGIFVCNNIITFYCLLIIKRLPFLTCHNYTHKRKMDYFVRTRRRLSLKVEEGIKNSEVGSSFSHVTVKSVR